MAVEMLVTRPDVARVRLLVSIVVTLSVFAAGLAPPASGFAASTNRQREPRSHTEQYIGGMPPLGFRADIWLFCGSYLPLPTGPIFPVCATFDVRPSEKWITVEIEDASGLDVPAWVLRDKDGHPNDGTNRKESKWICGHTETPIKIKSRFDGPVRVVPHTDSCGGSGPNEKTHPATTGTITVTFYEKRPQSELAE